MSCYRLRSYDVSPPGGYPYLQTDGIRREFKSQPLIEAQAQVVAGFRKANGLSRSSVIEALQDIDHFTCRRLGNMAGFCVPCDQTNPGKTALSSTSPIVNPCHGCGAPVT